MIEETFRGSTDPSVLPTAQRLTNVLAEPNFVVFSDALEDLHDDVHGSVNGTMGDVAYAAFDPSSGLTTA